MITELEQIQKAGFTVWSIGRDRLAQLLHTDRNRARRLLEKLRKDDGSDSESGITEDCQLKSSSTVKGDTWDISLPKTEIHTLQELIDKFEVDLTVWQCLEFTANHWQMGWVDREKNKANSHDLWQTKARFKRVDGWSLEAVKQEIEALKEEAKVRIRAPYVTIKRKQVEVGNALELSVYDAHFGRLCWSDETGWENYDLGIARAEYDKAVDVLLDRCKFNLDEICYVVGNDLLNFDSASGATTANTPQSNDSRYQKVFTYTRRIVQKQIEKLRAIAPVKVYFVPGNHDKLSVWHMGDSIECLYGSAKDVTVFNSPGQRKAYSYGKNLVMFTHGDKGKHKDYPLLLATEQRDLWASSTHREVHLGHLHQERVTELMGVKVRIIPALCPADAWHSENAYVGNIRGGQGFVWNKEEGLISTIEYSINNEAR